MPEPAAGEIRVRVRAASVNGFDLAVAAGYSKDAMEHRFPVVLGKDFAGEVDAIGEGATGFVEGDRVFGTVTKSYVGDGSFADYVTVPVAVGVAKLPDEVTFIDGGALGLAAVTARAAIHSAALEPGQTVLVVGATGGVGTQVVQLAAAAGARVLATAHTDEQRELVTRLGAGETVDHTEDLLAQVSAKAPDGVDVVVHLAGDLSALDLVRQGRRFVSPLLWSPDQVPTTPVTVSQVFPLELAADAMAAFATGKLGKIVITTD